MKKTIILLLVVSMSMGVFGMACSDKEEKKPEKGMIEEMTDNAAKKAASHLTAPLDRARDAQEVAQDHLNETQKALNE